MARTLKNADIQVISSTDLTELNYAVPSRSVATASLVITNLTINPLDIDVYINNGTNDYLLATNKIAGGDGKSWFVKELNLQKLNAGYKVKIQSSTTDSFNAFLSVSEISED
ncbi:MAG: hypothetical protein ACPGUE_12085 [Marinomonas sp.]